MKTLTVLFFTIFTISGTFAQIIDWSTVIPGYAFKEPLKDVPESDSNNSIRGRITNGFQVTDLSKFAYQVGIFSSKGDFQTGSWCGGSLISNQWVITAAHCIVNQYKSMIFLGFTDKKAPSKRGVNYIVEAPKSNLIVHKQYDAKSLTNDIALVKLPSPIKFTENIKSIALEKDTSISKWDGKTVLISGWGATTTGGPVIDQLQFVSVKVMPEEECKKTFDISANHICQSVVDNQGICQGDSGGPMAATENGKPVLIGLSSFTAVRGCNRDLPRVFTRISQYRKWICDKTNREVC